MRPLFIAATAWAFAAAGASAQQGKTPPFPASRDMETIIGWQVDHIDIAPADIVSLNEDAVVAMQRGTLVETANGGRAWFSRNVFNSEAARLLKGRSALLLFETQCDQARSRIVAVTIYSGTDLSGTPTDDNAGEPWAYDRPGTTGAAMAAAICRDEFLFDTASW